MWNSFSKQESVKLKVRSANGHSEALADESQGFEVDSSGSALRMTNFFNPSTLQPFNQKHLMTLSLKKAFTLAEVLITLVIIGVIAAITVPILFNHTSDREYNVARQKAKATIGEAFKLMTINGEIDKDKSTKEFIEEVLPKYLKVAKMCGSSDTAKNLTDCGFTSTVKRPDGTEISMTEIGQTWQSLGNPKIWVGTPTSAATWVTPGDYNSDSPKDHNTGYAVQTVDGFSLDIFYNPFCVSNTEEKIPWYTNIGKIQMSMDVVCFNAVYDMNGSKGPNQVGKDIGFVGSFYNSYSTNAEAVLPHDKPVNSSEAPGTSGTDTVLRASQYCKNLSDDDSWVVPNEDELSLLHINMNYLYDEEPELYFWSRSPHLGPSTPYFRFVVFQYRWGGARDWRPSDRTNIWVRCVRNSALK